MSYAIYMKIYLLSCTVIQAISYKNSLISPFRHVTVSNTTVYISGEGGIVALHRENLSEINVNITYKNNWLLLYNNGDVIQCNPDVANVSYCRKLNADLSDVTGSSINMTVDNIDIPVYTTVYIPQMNKNIFIVGSTSLKYRNTSYGVASFDLDDLSRGLMNIETEGKFRLSFKSSFVNNNFVYFLFQEWEFNSSRLGRMCISNNTTNIGYYHSYEDIKIECTHNGTTYDKVQYGIDEGDFIVVVFTGGSGSVLCTYNWTDIPNMYIDSRKSALKCNLPVESRYLQPKTFLEENRNTYCFENGKWCIKSDMNCKNITDELCGTHYLYNIKGNETAVKGNLQFNYMNKKITTIGVRQTVQQSVIVFAGTDDGSIGRLKSGNQTFYSIDKSKVLHILAEEETLHVLTENKYEMLRFENCSGHNSCEQCLLNDKCGWDYKEKRCSSNKTDQSWWISAKTGYCVKIKGLQRKRRMDSGAIQNFTFSLSIPETLSISTKFECGITGYANGSSLPKSKIPILCQIEQKQTYTRLLSGFYKFWISNENVTLVEEDIELINCGLFKTRCKECIKSGVCTFSQATVACARHQSGIKNEAECPTMTSIYPTIQPVTNASINISVNLQGFPKLTTGEVYGEDDLDCVFKTNDVVFTSSVLLDENRTSLTCIGVQVPLPGLFKVRLKFKESYADNDNITIEVYACRELESECGKCINLKDRGYNCNWCLAENKCYNPDTYTVCNDNSSAVCDVNITMVRPMSGPINGGTLVTMEGINLGTADYNISVLIDGSECTVNEVKEYRILQCRTGKVSSENLNSRITIIAKNTEFHQGAYFEYKNLNYDYDFKPTNGTLSGGKKISIHGKNIGFIGPERYRLRFGNDMERIECRIIDNVTTDNEIKCKTGNSSKDQIMTYLYIEIDTNTTINITKTFKYLPDPNITIPSGTTAQEGGGSTFNITGEGFYNVGEITVDRVEEKCDVPNDKTAVCKTPEFEGGSPNQTVNVNFDGITTQITIYYVPNPRFEKFGGILEYDDPEVAITIMGQDILNGAKKEDYKVDIGLDGKCLINTITMTAINCNPPQNVPRTNNTDPDVVYVIVEGGNLRTYIGDLRYGEKKNYLVIVVGVLAAALVVTVVAGVVTALTLKKKKRKAIKAFKMELLSREEMIRKASREEFAEAQMTIRDIKSDLVTTKVPYCDYQQYVFHILFPNQDIKTHPLLLASRVTDDSKIKMQKAMEMLDKLLTNKKFLESLVQTLDRLNKLTMQEKAHFASLLSIALTGNMRLFFNLVNSLLIETIHSGSKRQNKVLFRRFESISQRLMAHWLQIVLYTQLKTQSGLQLFMLYRAVQTVIEKAPVDALTSNSRNTLAEEKLLKMRVEFDSLTLQIDLNGNSDQHYPVKVLDCDTISQVKQKCVEQIYKNRPASDIPHNDELSLEWRIGKGGKHILEDEDTISDRNNGLVRLNTLKHYMVKDNSQMALMYKEHIVEDVYENQSHQLESVTSDDINLVVPGEGDEQAGNTLKWHLESCASNLPDDEKSNREQDIGDIFLNRLFHTKLLLSDYIEIAFEGLMDPQSLSVPIRYFLCMLDKLGKENDIEPDVIQIWKSECYATRLWGPLIGKPQIIFDVDVPAHVEPCMDILKQVFVECFTQTAHKVNKESPPQKLLFHKDIPQYRKRIEPFFIRVEPVDDQTFWGALDEISTSQKNEMKFSRQATLQQLYNLFIAKYSTEIIDDFLDMEESKDLGFGNKLEEVIELMEESATD